MKKHFAICAVTIMLLIVAWPKMLSAGFVDFDDATHMEVINNRYAAMGITFSGLLGGDVIAYTYAEGFPGHSPVSDPHMAYAEYTMQSPYEGIRIDFSIPVDYLSLYGCDYGGSPTTDIEIATLQAYASDGTLLGSITAEAVRSTRELPEADMPIDVAFLSLSGLGNIAYAEFTYTNTLGFFGIDDVDFGVAVIPAPGAIVLGGIGLGLVGYLRRRGAL